MRGTRDVRPSGAPADRLAGRVLPVESDLLERRADDGSRRSADSGEANRANVLFVLIGRAISVGKTIPIVVVFFYFL